jgi:hypothetical protein
VSSRRAEPRRPALERCWSAAIRCGGTSTPSDTRKQCRAASRATPRRARGVVALASASATARTARAGVASPPAPRRAARPARRAHHAARGDDLVERRERVARRAPTRCTTQATASSSTSSSASARMSAHLTFELVGGEQLELEVLGAAADGRQHLLRVGGGQHEQHVLGRLLERLQQRVGRAAARACGPRRGCTPSCGPASRRRAFDQVFGSRRRRCWTRRRARTGRSCARPPCPRTACTHSTARRRLEVLAVERLGEDASGRGLAGAARAGEQVGVALALVGARRCAGRRRRGPDRGPRRSDGAVAAVEGLVGHGPRLPAVTDPPPGGRTHPPVGGWGRGRGVRRRPGDLRHTAGSAESCCLPALTRFTGCDCTGPGRHLTTRAGSQAIVSARRRARAAESARLESVCGETHRGFESHRLRRVVSRDDRPARCEDVPLVASGPRYRSALRARSPTDVLAPTRSTTKWMRVALDEAGAARATGDVPIGAVVVQSADGTPRAVGHRGTPQRARAARRPDGSRRGARVARRSERARSLAPRRLL